MKLTIKSRFALALTALILMSLSLAPVAQAAPKMKTMPAKSAMTGKSVYVCTSCKAYYTPAAAKKMGYKDGMGHKLTKMSKVPAGYMDGSKMGM